MALRIIQVYTDPSQEKVLDKALVQDGVIDGWKVRCTGRALSTLPVSDSVSEDEKPDRRALEAEPDAVMSPEAVVAATDLTPPPEADKPYLLVNFLVNTNDSQSVLDRLQSVVGYRDDARIIMLPVEAMLPQLSEAEEAASRKRGSGFRGISREELYQEIAEGARLDHNHLMLVVFSALATAIGLVADNVAVVIGAMVIAPLLGPNLALAFSTVLCDFKLMWRAILTNLIGMGLALGIAFVLGLLWTFDPVSHELVSRTRVGFDAMALAFVAGAAGVLSLTRGVSSVLVGVMVAVALMPPTVTFGIMLAKGMTDAAIGAGLLLAVNVVCINLAANIIFWVKGVKPRTWMEKRAATRAMLWYGVLWIALLAGLAVAISYHDAVFKQKALQTPLAEQMKHSAP